MCVQGWMACDDIARSWTAIIGPGPARRGVLPSFGSVRSIQFNITRKTKKKEMASPDASSCSSNRVLYLPLLVSAKKVNPYLLDDPCRLQKLPCTPISDCPTFAFSSSEIYSATTSPSGKPEIKRAWEIKHDMGL